MWEGQERHVGIERPLPPVHAGVLLAGFYLGVTGVMVWMFRLPLVGVPLLGMGLALAVRSRSARPRIVHHDLRVGGVFRAEQVVMDDIVGIVRVRSARSMNWASRGTWLERVAVRTSDGVVSPLRGSEPVAETQERFAGLAIWLTRRVGNGLELAAPDTDQLSDEWIAALEECGVVVPPRRSGPALVGLPVVEAVPERSPIAWRVRCRRRRAPGWYPESHRPNTLRWFDGVAWTEWTIPFGSKPPSEPPR